MDGMNEEELAASAATVQRLSEIREMFKTDPQKAVAAFHEEFLNVMNPDERHTFGEDPALVIDKAYAYAIAASSRSARLLNDDQFGKERLLEWGTWAWGYTYRLRPNDDHFASQIACHVVRILCGMPAELALTAVVAAARWVDGAATTLTSSHKFFAALTCTKISRESFTDIHVPWPALLVTAPPGILVRPSDGVDFRFIFFYLLHDVEVSASTGRRQNVCAMIMMSSDARHLFRNFCARDDMSEALRIVLFDEYEGYDDEAEDKLSNEEVRLMQSARRALVGLLHTYQYTDNFTVAKTKKTGSGDPPREGPPPHRNIFFGKPLAYDCRPALEQYLRDGTIKNPPSVQTLVRGHYKRQVIGELRKGRKVIWVEPYWRGPINAPILSRPHQVG